MSNHTQRREAIGPFAYLASRVREEIAEARAAVESADAVSGVLSSNAWACTEHVSVDQYSEALFHPDWRFRAAVMQRLIEGTGREQDASWLGDAYRIAFDDPDPRVRGMAWLFLAKASNDSRHISTLVTLTVRAFFDRFHARIELHNQLEPGVRHWLSALQREAGRPDRKRTEAALADRYLSKLAGPDGPRINALGITELMEVLTHRDAGHRMAALSVLSRASRVSAVDAARSQRIIGLVGPTEAVKLLDKMDALHESRAGDFPRPESAIAESCASHVRNMIDHDPDVRVRSAAIRALGFFYFASGDIMINRLFARIALDRMAPDFMRYAACESLFMIHGKPMNEWPSERARKKSDAELAAIEPLYSYESVRDAHWESSIDWPFVEECARR